MLSLLLLLVLIAGLAGMKDLLLVLIAGLSGGTAGRFPALGITATSFFLFLALACTGRFPALGMGWLELVFDLHSCTYGSSSYMNIY